MLDLHYLKTTKSAMDGRYRLIDRIDGGGFSEVWLAHDIKSRVDVVLKIYASSQELNDEGIRMFRKEFALVCNLNHTNILKPFTFDICQGSPYIVLPYCEKGSASKFIGKITEDEVWNFLEQVATGLAHLHNHGIIHQDIKPANVLINADNQYMITDFGISTGLRNTIRKSVAADDMAGSGTTAYMSYECMGASPTNVMARDIWALGATLYELIVGKVPFGEYGGITQKSEGKKVPEIQENISDELKNLIYRCLAFDTWNRPSAEEIVQISDDHKRGIKPAPNHVPRYKLVAAIAACVVVVAGFWLWSKPDPKGPIAKHNPNDSILIAKIEMANEIVEREKHKPENERTEASLCEAAKLYSEAVGLEATDSVKRRGIEQWKSSQQVIDETYNYLSDKSEEYNSIGASSAFDTFRSRSEKLKPYVSRENIRNEY